MVLLGRAANTTQSLVSFHCSSQQTPGLCGAASSLLTLLLLHLCFISAPGLQAPLSGGSTLAYTQQLAESKSLFLSGPPHWERI